MTFTGLQALPSTGFVPNCT